MHILQNLCFVVVLASSSVFHATAQGTVNVILYQDVQFGGRPVERTVTTCNNVPRDFEREAESLAFVEGSCVAIYDQCGCIGQKTEITVDTLDLGNFKNQIVSLSPCGAYSNFPETMIENWYDLIDPHDNEPLTRVYGAGEIAVYFDANVLPGTNWMFNYLTQAWSYIKSNYGTFGSGERGMLMAMFHSQARAGINQPLYGLECNSGYRHGIHLMSPSVDAWSQESADSTLPRNENDIHVVTHEIAHVVESNPFNVLGSPAFPIWRDSKWAEIFNYDVYVNLGLTDLAERWKNQMLGGVDDFPRAGTHWFRDWFFPIYEQYGQGPMLARFFETLSQNFPQRPTATGQAYARDLNMGEFVHIWSGAARKNLKAQATLAFGWTTEMEQQFDNARTEFPNVSYSD